MKTSIFRKMQQNDSPGEVMVEAMILVIIIICAIFFTINIAGIYYNRITVASVAQEAASGAGAVYGSEGREPFVGYVPTGYFKNRDIYRYLSFDNSLNVQTEYKASWYGSYLLYTNEFATKHDTGISEYVVTSCEKESKLGCTMIHVSIEKEYPLFIANPMNFFGINPKYTSAATASAVCYDPIHQMNLMALGDELAGGVNDAFKLTKGLNDLETIGGKAAGGLMDILDNLAAIFKKS